MFDPTERDMCATLSQMERLSRERSNFDQVAAREKFREFIQRDRRFDEFDPDRLAARVQECLSHGAVLELGDSRLKGEAPRPLERNYW